VFFEPANPGRSPRTKANRDRPLPGRIELLPTPRTRDAS